MSFYSDFKMVKGKAYTRKDIRIRLSKFVHPENILKRFEWLENNGFLVLSNVNGLSENFNTYKIAKEWKIPIQTNIKTDKTGGTDF